MCANRYSVVKLSREGKYACVYVENFQLYACINWIMNEVGKWRCVFTCSHTPRSLTDLIEFATLLCDYVMLRGV